MLDILDAFKFRHLAESGVFKPSNDYSSVKKAIAVYKRMSGDVSHVEQSLLDPDYSHIVTPVSKSCNVNNERIGTLIDTFI